MIEPQYDQTDADNFHIAQENRRFRAALKAALSDRDDLLAALAGLIAQVITDSDACAICLNDVTRHVSGCIVPAAIAAIEKVEGRTP